MDDSMFTEAKRDNFATESPIRAFTSFEVDGRFAVGKGFRPSLAHLPRYLNAMYDKEGWKLLQILEATNPTMLFFQVSGTKIALKTETFDPVMPELRAKQKDWTQRGSDAPIPDDHWCTAAEYVIRRMIAGPEAHVEAAVRDFNKRFRPRVDSVQISHKTLAQQIQFITSGNIVRIKQLIDGYRDMVRLDLVEAERVRSIRTKDVRDPDAPNGIRVEPLPTEIKPVNDPINPKHYNGRECADIGERLTANGYQILKYCWRLGKKDDPCQELGKALWYLDSEEQLCISARYPHNMMPNTRGLKDPEKFFQERVEQQPEFTQIVASFLWDGYDRNTLHKLRAIIEEHKAHLDCGRGLAI